MVRIVWAAIVISGWVASVGANPPVLQPRPGGSGVPVKVLESRDLWVTGNPTVPTDKWPVARLTNPRRIMRQVQTKPGTILPLHVMWDEADHCVVTPDGKTVIARAGPGPEVRTRTGFVRAIIDVETGKVLTPAFAAAPVIGPFVHRVYPRLSLGRGGKAFLTILAFDFSGNGQIESPEWVSGVPRLPVRLAEMDLNGKALRTLDLGVVHWAAYGHDGKTIYALREDYRQQPGNTPRELVACSGKDVRKIRQLDRTKRKLSEVSPAEPVCLVLDWGLPNEPPGWGTLWLMDLKDGKRLWHSQVGPQGGWPYRRPIVWTRDGKYVCYEGRCRYQSGLNPKGRPIVKNNVPLTYLRNRADGSLVREVYVGGPVGRGPGASQIVCRRNLLYDVRTGQGWRIDDERNGSIVWADGGKVIFRKVVKYGPNSVVDIYLADLPDPSQKPRGDAAAKQTTVTVENAGAAEKSL